MLSLHEGHAQNTLWAGHVHPSICLSECFNFRITAWLRMKFGMGVMPLETTLNHTFERPE
jgi:hypothetical protein